jgi:ribosomal protein L40E
MPQHRTTSGARPGHRKRRCGATRLLLESFGELFLRRGVCGRWAGPGAFVEFVFLLIVIVLIALAVTARQNRRHAEQARMRLCQRCGLGHPPFAGYCRRCGTKLLER